MATWKQVRDYVESNYKYDYDEEGDFFKLIFDVGDDRTQVVFIQRLKNQKGTSWVEVSSPIGEIDKADIFDFLEELEETVCGGAIKRGDYIFIRNAILLDSIDSDSLDSALARIASIADDLENKYVGGDDN